MKLSLYELTNVYLDALNFLTDPDNEIDQQTAIDTMEGIDGSLDEKMLNVGRFISSIEAQSNAIAEIEKRQKLRRTALDNKAGWLREYLQASMSKSGHTAINSPDIALKLAKLPVSVQVDDESLIPSNFWKISESRSLDKMMIKSIGGCPGVRVESAGFRVSIK
jgi:hypothetical protein